MASGVRVRGVDWAVVVEVHLHVRYGEVAVQTHVDGGVVVCVDRHYLLQLGIPQRMCMVEQLLLQMKLEVLAVLLRGVRMGLWADRCSREMREVRTWLALMCTVLLANIPSRALRHYRCLLFFALLLLCLQ